ncbi:zinc ribbon domain-containing protein [Entomospira entomophila]|uniref:Zinc ribbon domain-containing protein n=1 Tax=Entomospira entomophila TaxID=2719988 RepID=A0A968KWN4_9SPIO|nr:zinc ribbon domain-containing protein [Entomospira entomophilus]NIZ40980.1 zinc ribbon domain-containing protein [Entomospira entomophilus]WDI35193.1 zinc ribbon domain-containing protein [Entomospira entomophilus]
MQHEIYCSQCGTQVQDSATHCTHCGRSVIIDKYYLKEPLPGLDTQKQLVIRYILKRFVPLFLILFFVLLFLGVSLILVKSEQFTSRMKDNLQIQKVSCITPMREVYHG